MSGESMIFSSDTNIWIDMDTIEMLDYAFQSSHEFYMSKEAIDNELLSPPGLNKRLVSLGLKSTVFDLNEFYLAEKYQNKYLKLTRYDALALSIAYQRKWNLLTGDGALRKAAQTEKINCVGTLWLLDDLRSSGCISCILYNQALVNIRKHNGKKIRLPAAEINARIVDS
jgi:hypothetical protein